jgi:voltage-gated potassium channel
MDKEQRLQMLEKFERATELPLLVLAAAMIPLLVVPFVMDLSETADRAVLSADWMIWAIFALELSVRTYLSERRVNYLIRHWYDVLIVVLPFLRPLRIVRSVRALRLLRLGRAWAFLVRSGTGTFSLLRRRGLQYVMLFGIVAIFASAGAVYLAEKSTGGTIDDYGTALWWAITTMTTVGYGDTVPVSAAGRGVAVFLMLVGISFFSWVTANIAAFLVEFGGEEGRTVTTADLMDKLEALEEEIRSLREVRVT